MAKYTDRTAAILEEVTEYLWSWDTDPTPKHIRAVLNDWISNLYSHIGKAAHEHLESLGIIDETGMTWDEQDLQMLLQISEYKQCLAEIG